MMKYWIALLLVFFIQQSQAQRDFEGGIVAGPVFSQISGDGLGGWDKLGFALGGWVNAPISERSSVVMSMKYITKGSRTKRDTINFNSFGFYLNYIDVPVLYQYEFNLKKSALRLSIGPYAGFLINQKVKANGLTYGVSEASEGPEFKRLDLGGSLGIAYWIADRFFMELSATTSIIPTRPAPLVVNKGSYYEQGNYNQTLQLMFGFRIGKNE